jgi:DNA-binding response OmpR family regulator
MTKLRHLDLFVESLTPTEARLLLALAEGAPDLLTREQLAAAADIGPGRTVDVHLVRLRPKIVGRAVIVTARGWGYRLAREEVSL